MGDDAKRLPAEEMVTIQLRVRRSNAERVKRFARSIEDENQDISGPWREVFTGLRLDDETPAAILRGFRLRQELTQARLSEITGVPRRLISEMEHGKRPIGKETAEILAGALKCDYRVFL
jgi:hypothetical protein